MNPIRFFVVAGLLLAPALVGAQATTHCKDPRLVGQVNVPLILYGWSGKEPKTVRTRLSVTIDKNGSVREPVVIDSGGPDVNKNVIGVVLKWKFTPKKCGDDTVETKVTLSIPTTLVNGKPY